MIDGIQGATRELVRPREFHTPDPQPASAREASTTAAALRKASIRSGAQLVEARVGRPYGLTPSLTLRVLDPARFLRYRLRSLLAYYSRNLERYEGQYLAIVDGNGRLVLETGGSTRIPAGSYWVRPDLDSCSLIAHGIPLHAKRPPPCPA
jgi:hypothetical protein